MENANDAIKMQTIFFFFCIYLRILHQSGKATEG